MLLMWRFFFFQAEDGIRDLTVTGVQTCALPIFCGTDANVFVSVPEESEKWEGTSARSRSEAAPTRPPTTHGRKLPGAATSDEARPTDRKSTRLNSSHSQISYAVFCLKKNNQTQIRANQHSRNHADHDGTEFRRESVEDHGLRVHHHLPSSPLRVASHT